jgi:hypothetical protein
LRKFRRDFYPDLCSLFFLIFDSVLKINIIDAIIISDEKIKDQYSLGSEIFENSTFKILKIQEVIINIEAKFLFIIFLKFE